MSDEDELPGGGLFEHLETVPQWGFRRPLHERIQDLIDELNPETAAARGPWMPDLRLRTPGETGDYWAGRIADFTVTVDNDLETRDDLADAARMYLSGHVEPDDWGMPETREDGRPVGYDEMVDRLNARREDRPVRDQTDWEEYDWEQAAEDLERNGPDDLLDEVYIHPAVFPGDARTLAEAEALVGTHPKHETLKELPGPCILCGADEVNVSVVRNIDGEIELTELTCRECDWRSTGGPADHVDAVDGEDQIPRYCPFCGEDHVRVTVTFEEGEVQETQLQCSRCDPGQA